MSLSVFIFYLNSFTLYGVFFAVMSLASMFSYIIMCSVPAYVAVIFGVIGIFGIGVLPTMVDRTKVSRTAIETLNEKYGEMLFRTSISKSIEAAKSSENGTPLCLTGHKLGQEYDELAQEVLSRC